MLPATVLAWRRRTSMAPLPKEAARQFERIFAYGTLWSAVHNIKSQALTDPTSSPIKTGIVLTFEDRRWLELHRLDYPKVLQNRLNGCLNRLKEPIYIDSLIFRPDVAKANLRHGNTEVYVTYREVPFETRPPLNRGGY